MKKLFLTAIATTIAFSSLTAADKALCLYGNDGARVVYALSDAPVVTLDRADGMTITVGDATAVYPLADVAYWAFEPVDAALPTLTSTKSSMLVTVSDSGVTVSGLEPGATITVSDMRGRVVARAEACQAGCAQLPLADKGVFILSTSSNQSAKFVK